MPKTVQKRVGERGAYAQFNRLYDSMIGLFCVGEGENQLFLEFLVLLMVTNESPNYMKKAGR